MPKDSRAGQMATANSLHCRSRPSARQQRSGALLVLALLLTGCSYPKPIRTYEFIIQHDRMTNQFEPVLSLVYVAQNVDLRRYENLVIGGVSVGEQWVEDPSEAARYATYLRARVRKILAKSGRFQEVTLDRDGSYPTPTLRLEVMVTKFDFGSGALRYFGWFLPLFQSKAASDFQIEGRLIDVASGAVVVEFADRRRHLGNTPFGPNPRTFRDDFVMKHTVKTTSRALAAFIKEAESTQHTGPLLELMELEREGG